MKKQPLKYVLNVVGASVIIFLLIRTYIMRIGIRIGLSQNYLIWIPVCMLILAFSCIAPVAFIENMCDYHSDIFRKSERKLSFYYDGALICFCMLMFFVFNVVNAVLLRILERYGIAFPSDTLPDLHGFAEYFLYFIFSAIIPAIFEELFLRLTVMNVLKPYGRKFAIIMSAFIFMLLHTKVQNYIAIFGAGITLACLYEYTGDIRMSMLLHFTNNSYSYATLLLNKMENGLSSLNVSFLMTLILVAMGMISEIYLIKNETHIYSVLKQDGKNAKFSQIFRSPVFMLSIMGCCIAVFSQLYQDLVK